LTWLRQAIIDGLGQRETGLAQLVCPYVAVRALRSGDAALIAGDQVASDIGTASPIDSRAARLEGVCSRITAVVVQRAKQWILTDDVMVSRIGKIESVLILNQIVVLRPHIAIDVWAVCGLRPDIVGEEAVPDDWPPADFSSRV
jgi:hypothetical protein